MCSLIPLPIKYFRDKLLMCSRQNSESEGNSRVFSSKQACYVPLNTPTLHSPWAMTNPRKYAKSRYRLCASQHK